MIVCSRNKDIARDTGVDPPGQVPLPEDHCDDPCDEVIPIGNQRSVKELEDGRGE